MPPKHRWKVLASLLGLLLAGLFFFNAWQGPQLAAQRVVRRDFVQSLVGSGRVETPHRVDIGAQITATVGRVPVAEGQRVKAGDVLIELVATELRAVQRQAEVAVSLAQARLRQMREVQAVMAQQALRQARANLEHAQATSRRNLALFSNGFIGAAALDEQRKAVELADAQLRSAERQLEATGIEGSDHAVALADLAQAQAGLELARARTRYAFLRAPVDGTLIGRHVEVGDVVQAGKVLMTLSPTGRTQLVLAIDEKNMHLLALGQKALASADAYPKQRFGASLVYINPGVNPQTGAVEVKLDVAQQLPHIGQDMTVSVDIEVARRPNALIVPADSVRDIDAAAPWVLRVEDGHAVRRSVGLGLQSGGMVEVLEGLREGDALVPTSLPVVAGARVRTLAPSR